MADQSQGLLSGQSGAQGILAILADYLSGNRGGIPASIYGAITLPGDVYSGRTQTRDENGNINPELIDRSTDLAGLVMSGTFGRVPAGAVGSTGARPYGNVPDNLMGFRRNGQNVPFAEQNWSFSQPVQVTFPASNGLPADTFTDVIKGLNQSHALERARRNWPGAEIIPIEQK